MILEELKSTSSKTEKQRIIRENKDNELFKETLVFLLSPYIVTGISDKKIRKKVKPSSELAPYKLCAFSTFQEVMKYLKQHNTGTDEDIYEIQSFLYGHEKDRMFYEGLITKSLKLGCDAKIINAVIPDLIPTFDVQLGTAIDKVKLKGNEYIYISQKLNGTRCISIDGKLYTRSGKEYVGLEHIIEDIEKLNLPDMVFDGELIRKNTDGKSDSENFQIGTGVANSKNKDKTCMEYVIFDCLPKKEFIKGESLFKYGWRKKYLTDIIAKKIKENNIENLRIVPMWYEGTDHSEIDKWLKYAEENDYEGCIAQLDTTYKCKRTKELIKVKCFYECDIRCIGVERGKETGKNKDTLGSIVCDYKGNKVNVSGFTEELRDYYWNNPDEIIGKIVTVKYKEETTNKNGGTSIQFPQFVCIRFDKDEPSYN